MGKIVAVFNQKGGVGKTATINNLAFELKERGKKVLIVDDVISTGESVAALEQLVETVGGELAGKFAVLAEGEAADRDDITYLEYLPLFNADGTPQ